jgi:hypothetical protein
LGKVTQTDASKLATKECRLPWRSQAAFVLSDKLSFSTRHVSCASYREEANNMQSPAYLKVGASFTVFLLFFGVATLEAFQTHNWIKAVFWLAIGFVFLVMGNRE